MQDDNGKTIQYDRRSFLVWEDAGVTAARNEENVYNISAIYLWITENKVSVPVLPIPAGLFGGEIRVDGPIPVTGNPPGRTGGKLWLKTFKLPL